MSRTQNQKSLIEQVENIDSINGRFEKFKCINRPEDGDGKGCLSLIFNAFDSVENKHVAVKFLDPEYHGNLYRLEGFNRESSILRRLKNKQRCLQLIYGPDTIKWKLSIDPNCDRSLPVNYFITEWLEEDIEPYFISPIDHDVKNRLEIFRSALLAVNSIHNAGISHRDIKYDNFRGKIDENNNLISVLIDFGTAAHSTDLSIVNTTDYPDFSVGAKAFAAPEALTGLARHRDIGKLTDIYALGSLLFKLFNYSTFVKARTSNNAFLQTLHYVSFLMAPFKKLEDREAIWKKEVPKLRHSVEPPSLDFKGNILPPSIANILIPLHRSMTLFDYQERLNDLQFAVRRIDIALKILSNNLAEKRKRILKEKVRANRIDKLRYRDKKLEEYLATKRQIPHV